MNILQLKRTSKNPIGLIIPDHENSILADGELLIAKEASNKDGIVDPENNISYIFVGDGENTLSELYNQRKFVRVSGYQIPVDGSVYGSKIPDSSIGMDKLSFVPMTAGDKDGLKSELLQLLIGDITKNSAYNRVHYAYCTSESVEKELVIADFVTSATDSISTDLYLTKEQANGSSFYVKFSNAHAGDSPTLTLKTADGNHSVYVRDESIDTKLANIPIHANGAPISSGYYWRAGSVISFVLEFNSSEDYHFNLVDSDALRTLSQWCDANNTTLINGAMIATGTITADKIRAGSITADKIAIGGLSADVFSNEVVKAFNDASIAAQQVNKNKTVYVTCTTDSDNVYKQIDLSQEQIDIISTGGVPYQGAGIVVSFTNANTTQSGDNQGAKVTYLRFNNSKYGVPFSSADGPIVRPNDSETGYTTELGSLNWDKENDPKANTRLFCYLNGQWIISMPTTTTRALAEWCRENDSTFIQGGTLITGKISCSELEAGIINTDDIKFGYTAYDAVSEKPVFTGMTAALGSSDGSPTKGMRIYSSTIGSEDQDCNFFHLSNKGITINHDLPDSDFTSHINMWAGKIMLSASKGISFDKYTDIGTGKNMPVTINCANAALVLPTADPHVKNALYISNNNVTISAG